MRDKTKLKKLNKVLSPHILTVYALIISILLLSSATYAFWTQPVLSEDDLLLEAESVTYLVSNLSPNNQDILLTPPIAAKDSLKNNNITIQTPASVVERVVTFRLMGKTVCHIIIDYKLYYLDEDNVFTELPNGVISTELWYDPDAGGTQSAYLLSHNPEKGGYYLSNFAYDKIASLTVKLSITVVDELLDPVYKGTEFRLNLSFTAQKTGGV